MRIALLFVISCYVLSRCIADDEESDEEVVADIPEEEYDFEKHETNHKVLFYNVTQDKNVSFLPVIKKRTKPDDFYYFLLGHPTDKRANQQHLKSYQAVHRAMQMLRIPGKAVIVNNDLPPPDSGREHELPPPHAEHFMEHINKEHQEEYSQAENYREPEGESFRSYWGNVERSNRVMDYGKQELGLQWQKPTDQTTTDFDFIGVIAHSWNDCVVNAKKQNVYSACLHVIQLRNYAHYFPSEVPVEKLEPVFRWIKMDLEKTYGTPTVIVFQEFDEHLQKIAAQLGTKLVTVEQQLNILAVVFSMITKGVNVEENLCSKVDRLNIPILSFGSLPSNSYFVLHWSPWNKGPKNVYHMTVKDSHTVLSDARKLHRKCMKLPSKEEL